MARTYHVKFSALKCNKFTDHVMKTSMPAPEYPKEVIITAEFDSEPTKEGINRLAKLIEGTPISYLTYFKDVKPITTEEEESGVL